MSHISTTTKTIAQLTASAFGLETPPVTHLWDDNHQSDIYVLQAADRPQKGVTCYCRNTR